MPRDPDTLREEARRDRERAAELADSNPSASDYYELRAARFLLIVASTSNPSCFGQTLPGSNCCRVYGIVLFVSSTSEFSE